MKQIMTELVSFFKKNNQINSILLGGSYSKGYATEQSDFDLFLLIADKGFNVFKESFSIYLESFYLIDVATFNMYVENWGYIFKAIGTFRGKNILMDIAILPLNRIEEMALRSSNIVLYDKNNYAQKAIEANKNACFESSVLEPKRTLDYVKLFGFEYLRSSTSLKNGDIWLAIKSIDRMRQYYMHYKRIFTSVYAPNPHCPEKNYYKDFKNDILIDIYIINLTTDIRSIENVRNDLFSAFYNLIAEKKILDRFIGE